MGYRLFIRQDENAESPREWDNLGTMYCKHGRYNLGDEDAQPVKLEPKDYIWLPLYLYDHSGITMSTTPFSCPWDSGQVGYIYVSKAKVREEYSCRRISESIRKRVLSVLRAEVKTYDQYLTGDVYGYILYRDEEDGAEIQEDTCWGFYGNDPNVNGMSDSLPVPVKDCELVYN